MGKLSKQEIQSLEKYIYDRETPEELKKKFRDILYSDQGKSFDDSRFKESQAIRQKPNKEDLSVSAIGTAQRNKMNQGSKIGSLDDIKARLSKLGNKGSKQTLFKSMDNESDIKKDRYNVLKSKQNQSELDDEDSAILEMGGMDIKLGKEMRPSGMLDSYSEKPGLTKDETGQEINPLKVSALVQKIKKMLMGEDEE